MARGSLVGRSPFVVRGPLVGWGPGGAFFVGGDTAADSLIDSGSRPGDGTGRKYKIARSAGDVKWRARRTHADLNSLTSNSPARSWKNPDIPPPIFRANSISP